MEHLDTDIFLLRGFVRSGTNWLGRIVNLHPDANCQGEFHLYPFKEFYKGYIKDFKDASCIFQNDKGNILSTELNKFFRGVIRRYADNRKYKLVGNRTPAGLTDFWLPSAKHLIISRDGRSVVTSWFFHTLKHPTKEINDYPLLLKAYEKYTENKNFFDNNPELLLRDEKFFKLIVKRWNDRVANDKNLTRQSDEGKIPLHYYWVNYEELHQNVEKGRNEIYTYLGLDPAKANPLDEGTIPGFTKENNNSNGKVRARGVVNSWDKYFTDANHQWFAEVGQQGLDIHESTKTLIT